MAGVDSDLLVDHPTWFEHVRHFFTDDDVAHMGKKSIDLGTYKGVVGNAISIYSQTESGAMPPGTATKWSANRVKSFLNWITDGFPVGTPPPAPLKIKFTGASTAARVRKDASSLTTDEIAALKAAFAGLMARDPSAPDSYFAIAGIHWFPAIDQNPLFHCLHHENRFLPWHRLHLKRFEDALRSVDGCAAVTLPYWDITAPVPSFLYEAPFKEYALQASIGHDYDPLVTSRYDVEEVAATIAEDQLEDAIRSALTQTTWEVFNRAFWHVHDNGHVACGTTMENQDISAFDPIFWLFHCNLDRIWLQWQRAAKATTVALFKSTCTESTAWLDVPALGALPPFDGAAADTIDPGEIDYAAPANEVGELAFENATGNVAAARRFRIQRASPLSIRVKDINRAQIPGTFVVHLLADGKRIARQAFFQPTDPGVCPSCSKNANVSVDFRVPADTILDKQLSVEIHVLSQRAIGTRFPVSKAGEPTINVRHLLEGE